MTDEYSVTPFKLNLQEIDLPNVTDENVINAYNNCIALQFDSIEDVNLNSLFLFLLNNPFFANYGFHKGFGTTLFNMMLMQKRSERWVLQIFLKMHMLGVKDANFMALATKLLD